MWPCLLLATGAGRDPASWPRRTCRLGFLPSPCRRLLATAGALVSQTPSVACTRRLSVQHDAIYMASIGDPGTWVNTGATLPINLGSSSLAIVENNIYLFGGYTIVTDGYQQPIDVILTAPNSNPLLWTIVGSLPVAVHSAALGMANDYLFLAGGNTGTSATNQVMTASISSPTSWSVSSNTLPLPIYGSTIIQTDGYWYLLGGQTSPTNLISNIIYSYVANPTVWLTYGSMTYASSYGAFFPMGQDGYYIGPAMNYGYDISTFT